MRRRRWTSDTIGRWFAINIVVAVIIAAAMNAAFSAFAGVWAKPGLKDIGLVDEVAAVARILDGAPRDDRAKLAASVSNDRYAVTWFPNDAALPIAIDASDFQQGRSKIRTLLGRSSARVVAYEPGDLDLDGRPETAYGLAISLSDGSWVRFVAAQRSWGLSSTARTLLTVGFAVVCALVVATLASRRLARPMERFARQAQRFGADVNAPPMEADGPEEIRLAGQAFNEMQARVQRYVADRTTMLAAISHDLRAPLTRMRLRGEFIDDEDQQRKLFRDVDEMQAMVDASLDFFRDDSEQEPTTRFALSELIDTVLDDFRDAGHAVAFDTAGHVTYVGRPLTLRRAIANLVDNAIKYGGRAHVRLRPGDGWIDILVDDDGPGIPEALRETVFRPFYRIEGSRNRQTGGVGLGLAAVRSAVRGHGGDITLDTAPGGGLRVHVKLPVVAEA